MQTKPVFSSPLLSWAQDGVDFVLPCSRPQVELPRNFAQAVALLEQALGSEGMQAWGMQPKNQALRGQHFGLGLWIRNQWVYPPAPWMAELCPEGADPDGVSSWILEALWCHCAGEPLPEQAFAGYQVLQPLDWT